MAAKSQLVRIAEEAGSAGILSAGDVEISSASVEAALAALEESDPLLEKKQKLIKPLAGAYKRVVLSASHIHSRRKHKDPSWGSGEHLSECLRQHRAYFKRRGVATSLDMEPEIAFGKKGVTGTANDRDVFLAFMKRIGLEDAASPNAVAAAVMKGLREHAVTKGQDENVYGNLFQAMAKRPGQNIEREIFDEAIGSADFGGAIDEAYATLCELTRLRYVALNQAISLAHQRLQVSLTLEREGIARFSLNNPFGMAIPYEGSLFRVYELDDAHHVARVCPTFFTIEGGDVEEAPFELVPVSHGGMENLDEIEKFRIGEIYVPATVEQLEKVGQFALEHCKFDVAVLSADSEQVFGSVLDGSGGAIRTVRLAGGAKELREELERKKPE